LLNWSVVHLSKEVPVADNKTPVRDLPEKKIPAGKADQIKGGRKRPA